MHCEASSANDKTLVLKLTPWNSDLTVAMFCVGVPVLSEQNKPCRLEIETYAVSAGKCLDIVAFTEASKLPRRRVAI